MEFVRREKKNAHAIYVKNLQTNIKIYVITCLGNFLKVSFDILRYKKSHILNESQELKFYNELNRAFLSIVVFEIKVCKDALYN